MPIFILSLIYKESSHSLTVDGGVGQVRVHGWAVVTPNSEVLDFVDVASSLFSNLAESSVVIQSGHGSEVFFWDVLGVVSGDHAVSVGWVSDNNNLNTSLGVVIEGLASADENLSVVLEEVSSFHAWSSWLGSDEESVVNILETGRKIVVAFDSSGGWEGAILDFHFHTLEKEAE